MIDLSEHQNKRLAIYKDQLARLERGESLAADRPGSLSPDERATAIARLKALISQVESK